MKESMKIEKGVSEQSENMFRNPLQNYVWGKSNFANGS